MTALAGLMLSYLFFFTFATEEEIVQKIQFSLAEKVEQINLQLTEFKLKDDYTDSDIQLYAYDALGNLIYWNNNSIVPNPIEIQAASSEVIYKSSDGIFIYQKLKKTEENREYLLIGMYKIKRTFSQNNEYLTDTYNREILPGNIEITEESNAIPIQYLGEDLFFIKCTGASFFDEGTNWLITLLLLLLTLGLLIGGFQIANWFLGKFGFMVAFSFFLLELIFFRLSMLLTALPVSFGRMQMFEPSIFSFRDFYVTLGDGLVNVFFINLLLLFLVKHRRLIPINLGKGNFMLSILLMTATYVVIYLFSDTILIIIRNSQISLDIAESLEFSLERIVVYAMLLLVAAMYFLSHFLSFGYAEQLNIGSKKVLIFHLAAIVLATTLLYDYSMFWLILPINVVYTWMVWRFKMPDSLSSLKFGSVNYILMTAIILSCIGSFMIYKSYEKKSLYHMQQFATYLQFDRDVEGEYFLYSTTEQIKSDLIINSKMINPAGQADKIATRIRRFYLNTYFGDYEINVNLYDAEGHAISPAHLTESIHARREKYLSSSYKTAYENIFFDGKMDVNKRLKYVCFITIEKYGSISGFIEIELRQKKFSSRRVLPQLMVSRDTEISNSYSYAFVVDGELIHTSGDFEYESSFDLQWLSQAGTQTIGLEKNGFDHIYVKVGDRTTIVTSAVYPFKSIVSNFSFLFILLVMAGGMAGWVKFYLFKQNEQGILNFSTKILLYSGASFTVPLLLVALAVLTTTDSSYRQEIDSSNLKKTLLLAENLDDPMTLFSQRKTNKEGFENVVTSLAANAGMDVNIYTLKGKLLASSTPEIFESRLISEYLNPEVMNDLINRNRDRVIMEESIGKYQYKTSYVSINSSDDGKSLGILASPYFASKSHLERQQSQVFGNIINIFTFIFIISIGVAYLVISRLTMPIMEIAARLHTTGFVQNNLPIEWSADDEIGSLVKEYNAMLVKLEESKIEMARNEKEAAWREMAKQVAHEIKNPLTPMKLTIQHLSRISDTKNEHKKSLDLLLNQIDVLDEIVTSFSHFAKMPTPENEPFDIKNILIRSIELHVDRSIQSDIPEGEYIINGDKKLFGRIFNNLILNAFEAMKTVSEPILDVSLQLENDHILIRFTDCGEGISVENSEKVFVPNFSTKAAGSGIGLAVAKRGIEHAGGKIWFESELNVGTTFFISLPVYSIEVNFQNS